MFPGRLNAIRVMICLLAVMIPSVASAALPEACVAPELLLPNDTERQVEGFLGGDRCYHLELPTAGFWHLSIASPRPAASRARFEILDAAGHRASLETFERSAAERLAFVPAGAWLIRVRPEDPLRLLPAYRLTSRFVEAARSELAWKSEEDGELEIEGEGLVAGCGAFASTTASFLKSEEDGELEIEGEGLVAGCVDRAAEIRRTLCSAGDDHGDTLACATPVRCRARGELDNGWGDDADAFRFRVDGWQTVEIAACGATRGELFDGAGQRLDAAGGNGGFRLVRTLGPGTYFVRVAGESAGGYGLEIRTLDR